ncbi:MAG: S9 family peptidase [Bifidobacteriaceae bacterium]|jgi:dipeptidyl aminopeptidase/acylaminoacyl peptidase|nr:S9 family peptidase [Bifidobacteriaceae bacterium]
MTDTPPGADAPATPFHDLETYVAWPRLSGLTLSPDGARLIVGVATVNPDQDGYVSALWEVDPTGASPARRLTTPAAGTASAAFAANGDLLFASRRPDPAAPKDEPAACGLWLLPPVGEARPLARRAAGIDVVWTARRAPVAVFGTPVLPASADLEADDAAQAARRKARVGAILHSAYPVRFWDADLGPATRRLFALAEGEPWRDITPPTGTAPPEPVADLSPDGSKLAAIWVIGQAKGRVRRIAAVIDLAGGRTEAMVEVPGADVTEVAFSPDGARLAYVTAADTSPDQPTDVHLWVAAADGSGARRLAAEWDRWPRQIAWLPSGDGLLAVADDQGRAPVFWVPLDGGQPSRVTADAAAFSDLAVAPDGSACYALRSTWTEPPEVARVDLGLFRSLGEPVSAEPLPGPAPRPALPGRLDEFVVQTADGAAVHSWLALPAGAGPEAPAPALLWIHGGPVLSWNGWSWRWNPWIMTALGYAVALPDPALSTGYGRAFVGRGWGDWGGAPFRDLMAVADALAARPDIDAQRTAAMGGSFGGYMANWVAGHTDRFRAIVAHAGLWNLDSFGSSTDAAFFWAQEMTPEMAAANSPGASVAQVTTPMLVIHGNKDYRVPLEQSLSEWYQLLSESALAAGPDGATPHRFLYFPDENHWILAPQNARIWYQVVTAFLAEHVLGAAATYPALLGTAPGPG